MFYYLVPGSLAHTEIRYVLTLHWLLPIFAGAAVVAFARLTRHRRSSHVQPVGDPA
jgi:beta-lactamase regulating signal transducer with metallopeptidase domain